MWFDDIEVVLEHMGCPLDLLVQSPVEQSEDRDRSSGGMFLLHHWGAVVWRRQPGRSFTWCLNRNQGEEDRVHGSRAEGHDSGRASS